MIELNAGKMRAEFAPAHGGAVLSLDSDGVDILRPAVSLDAVAADPREAACYPCVPWFSRLPDGLDFDGRHYGLAPTLPACDPEYPLHGHGWVSAWEITAHTASELHCRMDHEPTPRAFPFPFSASQHFSLSGHEFSVTLSVTNTGATPMPVGMGLHPFFPRSPDTKLTLSERPEQQHLSGRPQAPIRVDHSGPIPDGAIDDTITGWDGAAEIVRKDMKIELRSNARFLHLYSPEGAEYFCAEPVSHLPGQFGDDILAPGETTILTLSISVF